MIRTDAHVGLAPGQTLDVRPGIPDDWDEVIGPTLATLRRRWITLAEARLPGVAHTFTLSTAGEMSVAMVGGLMDGPTGHVRFDPFRVLSGGSVADGVVEQGPHPWQGRTPDEVFPCCVLMFPNYETAPVGPGAHDGGALGVFLAEVIGWSRRRNLRSIAVLFVHPDYPAFADALRGAGFDTVPMVKRADLAVTWTDFDGYIAGLRRNRRFAVRRELRDVAARGVSIGERSLQEHEPDLLRLRSKIVKKYGGLPDEEREATSLRHLREHFGASNVLVVEARQGDALLSFSILIRDGDQWTALMSGTDYDRPDASFTYFATMFYRPAELAPEHGIRTIAYGLGTLAAKQFRGCTVHTLSAAALVLD